MSTPATFKIVCATPCAGNVQKNTKSNLCTTFVLDEQKYDVTIPLNLSNVCNVVLPPTFKGGTPCTIIDTAFTGLKDGQLINFYNFSLEYLIFSITDVIPPPVIYYPEGTGFVTIKVTNKTPVIGYYNEKVLYITGGKGETNL